MAEKAQKDRKLGPDYRRIYEELIRKKFPEQWNALQPFLVHKQLTYFEVNRLNELLFGQKNKAQQAQAQKYKSYDKETILKILDYKKKHKLNNTQLALHFKLSRNTVAKWLKIFDSHNS